MDTPELKLYRVHHVATGQYWTGGLSMGTWSCAGKWYRRKWDALRVVRYVYAKRPWTEGDLRIETYDVRLEEEEICPRPD